MCILNDLAGQGNVLFEGEGGAVDHDGGIAGVDGLHTFLIGAAVIQMQSDGNGGVGSSTLDRLDGACEAAHQIAAVRTGNENHRRI